ATSFSLSMTARRRNTARSMTIEIVIINRNRIGHIPHPPSWNASANILRTIIRLLLRSSEFDSVRCGGASLAGSTRLRWKSRKLLRPLLQTAPALTEASETVALVVPFGFVRVSSRFHASALTEGVAF